ncbi:hypothetical protein DV737_g76, partial [Chaetothyriales sp. CBS 132003]
MFYSHELLTDRRHGVATIWLVATLGSRSNLRTVSRKAITDINVSKACETITNPELPLALRLQASLLYGVARVHSHQCGYVLSDMHSFKDRISEIARTGTRLEIDLHTGNMRREHLNLPEDPMFMPELDLSFDLSAFDCLSHDALATQESAGQGQAQQTDFPSFQGSASPATANAPQQRARKSKPLQVDARAELTNAELHRWTNNYLAHMTSVIRHKEHCGSVAQAKKNAAFWIMRQGVGSVEILFGQDRIDHPLATFSGQSLLDALRGSRSSPPGSKRPHSPTEDEEQQSRRVRARMGGDDDEEDIILGDDDIRIESEIGRHAQSSLPDRPSVMPWNMSGSRQGSAVARLFGSTAYRVPSSAGEVTGLPQAFSRRGSRFTSASPLLGKGRSRLPSLDTQATTTDTGLDIGLGLGSDVDNFNPDDLGIQSPSQDFEFYAPSAKVDAQTAANSQWLKTTMEDEAINFLDFLDTKIAERGVDMLRAADEATSMEVRAGKSITLDELLPPVENTSVVGAQALLHVLSLATKGFVDVEQTEPWETIRLWIVSETRSKGDEEI